MKKLLLVLSFSLLASSAYAADAVIEEVAVVDTAHNWSGVYLGAQAGYDWGDHSETEYLATGAFSYSQDFDSDGASGGLFGGYNWQSSQFVFGVDANIDYSNIDGGYSITNLGGTGSTDLSINWQGALRARVGVALDRILLYAAAGGAVADAEYDFGVDGVLDETFDETLWGWTVGAGVDAAITDNIFVRAEYRYTDFEDVTLVPQNTFAGNTYDESTNIQAVRFGVAYKF